MAGRLPSGNCVLDTCRARLSAEHHFSHWASNLRRPGAASGRGVDAPSHHLRCAGAAHAQASTRMRRDTCAPCDGPGSTAAHAVHEAAAGELGDHVTADEVGGVPVADSGCAGVFLLRPTLCCVAGDADLEPGAKYGRTPKKTHSSEQRLTFGTWSRACKNACRSLRFAST